MGTCDCVGETSPEELHLYQPETNEMKLKSINNEVYIYLISRTLAVVFISYVF